MVRLYLVYLGDRTPQSNIELHDVQFVVGETIDDTLPSLRSRWFGSERGLHIDIYAQI